MFCILKRKYHKVLRNPLLSSFSLRSEYIIWSYVGTVRESSNMSPSLSLHSFSCTTFNQNYMTAEDDTASRNNLRLNALDIQPQFERLMDRSSSRRPETDPMFMCDGSFYKHFGHLPGFHYTRASCASFPNA